MLTHWLKKARCVDSLYLRDISRVALIACLLFASFHLLAFSRVLRVPDMYLTIQQALDVASPGDEIIVSSGVYHEQLIISTPVALVGEDTGTGRPIIDGSSYSLVVKLMAPNCTIRGFVIKGVITGTGGECGILCLSSGNVITDNLIIVENNSLVGCRDGGSGAIRIYAGNCAGNADQNKIINNEIKIIDNIRSLYQSYDITSISIGCANQNIIQGNTFMYIPTYAESEYNNNSAVWIGDSVGNVVENNVFNQHKEGIAVDASADTVIKGNTFTNCRLAIHLWHASGTIIAHNIVTDCRDNLNLYRDCGTRIFCNTFVSGVILATWTTESYVYLNNFLGSPSRGVLSRDIYFQSPEEITYLYRGRVFTGFVGNYWEDYRGMDADGDGIGETPYCVDYPVYDPRPLIERWENYSTGPDVRPPAIVNDFAASDGEDGQCTLRWTNPPDDDLAEVVVRRKTDGYPANHTDGTLIYQDTSPVPGARIQYVDTNLTNGTTYYYAVFARDAAGQWNDAVVEGANADCATPQGIVVRLSMTPANTLFVPLRTEVVLDASESYDTTGGALQFEWILYKFSAAGLEEIAESRQSSFSFSLKTQGSYYVFLKLTSQGHSVIKRVPINTTVIHIVPGFGQTPNGHDDYGLILSFWWPSISWQHALDMLSQVTVLRVVFQSANFNEQYMINLGDLSSEYLVNDPNNQGAANYEVFAIVPGSLRGNKIDYKIQGLGDCGMICVESELLTKICGDMIWGVTTDLRNVDGDHVFPEVTAQWVAEKLASMGVEACKFWMNWGLIENDVPIDSVPAESDLPDLSVQYATARPGQPFDSRVGTVDWTLYDEIVETLNSYGIMPVPWFAEGGATPFLRGANDVRIAPFDNKEGVVTDNQGRQYQGIGRTAYLIRARLVAMAAAQRYSRGLKRIVLWNVENELNWVPVHVLWGWRARDLGHLDWLDRSFRITLQTNLAEGIREGSKRSHDGMCQAVVTTNIHETGVVLESQFYNLLYTMLTGWLSSEGLPEADAGSVVRSLLGAPKSFSDVIRDWSASLDVVGLGTYNNYLFGWPALGTSVGSYVARVRSAVEKPVIVVETGYPLLAPGGTEAGQKEYLCAAALSTKAEGGSGFFWFMLADRSSAPPGSPEQEKEWGLLKYVPGSSDPWVQRPACAAYEDIIKRGSTPCPDTMRTVGPGVAGVPIVSGIVVNLEEQRVRLDFSTATVGEKGTFAFVELALETVPQELKAGLILYRLLELCVSGNLEGDLKVQVGYDEIPDGQTPEMFYWDLDNKRWVAAFNLVVDQIKRIVEGTIPISSLKGTLVALATTSPLAPVPRTVMVTHGPNPVPPEGCIFWLNLPSDATAATLKIFAVDGALLVSIPLDPNADRYPASGRWRPEDDHGRLLGTGLYLYTVEIKHSDGRVTYSPIQKMVVRR